MSVATDTEEQVGFDDVSELDIDIELDEASTEFVDELVKKLVLFTEEFCGVEFFPYQIPIAYRFIESVVVGDGEELTLIAPARVVSQRCCPTSLPP